MKRPLVFGSAFAILWIAMALPCPAWVMLRTLGKGEVSHFVSAESRSVLLKVPPIGGTEVNGSWSSCTMYYRGTQESLQELIDGLAKIEDNAVFVRLNRSGKPGRVEPSKMHRFPRPIVYQFSVSVSNVGLRRLGKDGRTSIAIIVHASGGIDPDKVVIPPPKPSRIQKREVFVLPNRVKSSDKNKLTNLLKLDLTKRPERKKTD